MSAPRNLPAPPGETGRELSASDTFALMDTLLQSLTGPPTARIRLESIRNVGPRFLAVVLVRDFKQRGLTTEVSLRVTRERLTAIRDMCNEALGV